MNPSDRQTTPSSGAPRLPIRTAIVEDEEDIREGIGELFDFTDGFRCTGRYRTMEEALARLGAVTPDVMLVDYQLPDTNGIRLVESLWRRFGAGTPAIMISAYSNRRDASLDAGFQGFLHKPYEAHDLAFAIERALAR